MADDDLYTLQLLDAATKRCCELSFIDFMEEMWPVVEAKPFKRCWHHVLLCDHLQAVTRGEIKNLLINVPPACTKSLTVSVLWPCWSWIADPSSRWFCVTYHQHYSTYHSTLCRKLIESDAYQRYWGDVVKLAGDQNQKTFYETTAGGYRLATTIGGHATGAHPDYVVIDDPNDVKGAESETQRLTTNHWFDMTMPTRGASRGVRRVLVQQRLHADDLSGHILARYADEWEHICLPMHYEPGRMRPTKIGGVDPRSREGELLCPDYLSAATVATLEKPLGVYGVAGQMQQRPSPLGGGMFKRHYFECVDAVPAQARRARYWDKAATKNAGAYSAGCLMAEARGVYYIEGIKRAQLDPFERNAMIRATCEEDNARYHHSVRTIVEQEPSAGGKESALISIRELAGYAVESDRAHTGKEQRAYAFASQCGASNVKIVGKPTDPWVIDLLDELEQFPNGKFKDQVDACTGAFNRLTLGVGVMSDMDLFGSEGDDKPLTKEEMEDLPEFFRELLNDEDEEDRRRYDGMSYDPTELAE